MIQYCIHSPHYTLHSTLYSLTTHTLIHSLPTTSPLRDSAIVVEFLIFCSFWLVLFFIFYFLHFWGVSRHLFLPFFFPTPPSWPFGRNRPCGNPDCRPDRSPRGAIQTIFIYLKSAFWGDPKRNHSSLVSYSVQRPIPFLHPLSLSPPSLSRVLPQSSDPRNLVAISSLVVSGTTDLRLRPIAPVQDGMCPPTLNHFASPVSLSTLLLFSFLSLPSTLPPETSGLLSFFPAARFNLRSAVCNILRPAYLLLPFFASPQS